MVTLTINKNSKLKDLKEYCQSKGILPIGNRSHKQSWIKGYEKWLSEQNSLSVISEVKENTQESLPELTDFNHPRLKLNNLNTSIIHLEIPVVECEVDNVFNFKDRLSIINELFIKFGEKYKFKVKIEKKHDYTEFNQTRLLEHLLWWFLVRGKKISQTQVSRLWKTPQKEIYSKQLLTDPIVSEYFNMLFK